MTTFVQSPAEITEVRARRPERVAELLSTRRRRDLLPLDGRLMLVACDHPARGALSVRGRPDAMADRNDLLERLQVALSRPGVDGLLATADVVEDLLLLGSLEDKVVITSMNRGGLYGSVFEMDDRMTAYDVKATVDSGFNGAKMLTRIDLEDRSTVSTLEACGRAVTELGRAGLVAMLEPFMSTRKDGRYVNDLQPDAVIRSVHIAQGLGRVLGDADRGDVTLLLGGDPAGHPDETYAEWAKALALPSVRGLVVGRALLYPLDDDVADAVDTAVALVRPGA